MRPCRLGRRGRLAAAAAIVALAAPARPATAADPVLCIGDSLTYGVGGRGTTWPQVLTQISGRPTITDAISGWIPRHLRDHVLLHDLTSVTVEQLRSIPPLEYEDRRNQPKINALRTLILPGQTVRVAARGEFVWDPRSSADSATTIKPLAVGDPSHHPFIPTGRWAQVAPGVSIRPIPIHPVLSGAVLWLGGNGMEPEAITSALRDMLAALPLPKGHFLVLGLINRANAAEAPHIVEDWARWIDECNRTTAQAYPGHFLDLQAWMTGKGYRTREWFPTATDEQVREDQADQGHGLLPRSLRAPENYTHLNATGYRIIATLVRPLVDRW